jgi:hypothetical protein
MSSVQYFSYIQDETMFNNVEMREGWASPSTATTLEKV